MKEKVTLVCLNPQGAVELPAPTGLANPRVKDLAGKKIGIFWDGKRGGDNFCIAVEELLQKKYPTAKFVGPDIIDAEKYPTEQAFLDALPNLLNQNKCDAFISGNGC